MPVRPSCAAFICPCRITSRCRHSGSPVAIACEVRIIVFAAATIRNMLIGPSSYPHIRAQKRSGSGLRICTG